MGRILTLILLLSFLGGCASKLDQVRKMRTPQSQFVGEKIELSKLHFVTLDEESPTSLGDYMHAKNLQHVLLVFGAKDCGKCQEKNVDLRDNYYGQHPLFTETEGFELIGVTTEPAAQRKKGQRLRQAKALGLCPVDGSERIGCAAEFDNGRRILWDSLYGHDRQ